MSPIVYTQMLEEDVDVIADSTVLDPHDADDILIRLPNAYPVEDIQLPLS